MTKPVSMVLTEATTIGLLLLPLFYMILYLTNDIFQTTPYKLAIQLFITGSLFHLLCEFSGLNTWYAKNYVTTYKI